jgi:hypothetical protein
VYLPDLQNLTVHGSDFETTAAILQMFSDPQAKLHVSIMTGSFSSVTGFNVRVLERVEQFRKNILGSTPSTLSLVITNERFAQQHAYLTIEIEAGQENETPFLLYSYTFSKITRDPLLDLVKTLQITLKDDVHPHLPGPDGFPALQNLIICEEPSPLADEGWVRCTQDLQVWISARLQLGRAFKTIKFRAFRDETKLKVLFDRLVAEQAAENVIWASTCPSIV